MNGVSGSHHHLCSPKIHICLSQKPPTQPFRSVLQNRKRKIMNRYGYQQNALMGCVGVGEIRRGDISISNGLVCPKPSRFLQINNLQMEGCNLKSGTELLDIILTKENYDMEMASSPSFFFGSPPSRASNPLIQDSLFSNNNFVPILTNPEGGEAAASAANSPPQPSSGGGCSPVKFGIKPAAVRIEGFNCRSRISAVA